MTSEQGMSLSQETSLKLLVLPDLWCRPCKCVTHFMEIFADVCGGGSLHPSHSLGSITHETVNTMV